MTPTEGNGPRLVFLVGARRSGTNWLHRILTAHPDIIGVPSETELFSLGIAPLMARFHHGAIGSWKVGSIYMERAELIRAIRRFCDEVFGAVHRTLGPDVPVLLERTPRHSIHMGLMAEIYPDANFVHIIRDGRDVARSLVSQGWGPDSIRTAAQEWVDSVGNARAAGSGLERYIEVRYEELLADPRGHVARLYSWLGVNASDDVLERALAEAKVPYNVDTTDRRIAEGKWRSAFTSHDLQVFNEVAAKTLIDCGYDLGRDPLRRATDRGEQTAGPARMAVTRSRRLFRKPDRTSAFYAERIARLRAAQEVADALLDLIAARRFDRLSALFTHDAMVSVIDSEDGWKDRGERAVERWADEIKRETAIGGRQVRGDVHPGQPTFTILLSYVTPDNERHERVIVMGIEGSSVTNLTYYRFDQTGPQA